MSIVPSGRLCFGGADDNPRVMTCHKTTSCLIDPENREIQFYV